MSKYTLITRQEERSRNLSNLLKKEGHEIYFSPLFDVQYLHCDIKIKDFKALIITSANAVKSIVDLGIDKNIKIFSVGKITTFELEKAGFKNIQTALRQDAISLKELIISNYHLDKEILYFCGEKITLDFQKELEKFGIKVKKYVSYKTNPRQQIEANISCMKFDYIMIFSKYSAKIFLELMDKNSELKSNFKLAKILCFSNKIADEFKNSDFEKIGNFEELKILKEYYLL